MPGSSSRPRVSVVWFKVTDLRLHDHEPLCKAHASGLPVLHLFVFDPRWFRRTPLCGFPRTGPIRANFQLEALRDLSRRLTAGGHSLSIRRGKSTALVFEELCRDFRIEGVYASREVCSEELRVEQAVRDVLHRYGQGPLRLFWTFELHHYEDLPQHLRQHGSNSYTGYQNVFQSKCEPRPPLGRPDLKRTAPGLRWDRSEELPAHVGELGLQAVPPLDDRAEVQWVGGETAALARVEYYLFRTDGLALDYVGSTNTPREGNSCIKPGAMSRLSPWLAHGCLSTRWLYQEIKRYERERYKSSSTYWLVHELYWRDFVRFSSLLHGDKIFKIGGIYNRHPQWKWSRDLGLLNEWAQGTTGFPFMDAPMREIRRTGYACHVGRETAAWFLICDLGLDWRMGAEWFESVLIDYEPAANWFCWAFICLVRATEGNGFREIGHPSLPPLTRLQTAEVVFLSAQHDPDAEYIKLWVPELGGLTGLFAREPWRIGFTPVAAVRGSRHPPEAPPAGPERVQMARRTLTKGGPQVAVWWECCRQKGMLDRDAKASATNTWPQGYPLPICPPSSFFTIEDVADAARRKQRQKADRMKKLRQMLSSPASLNSVRTVFIADSDSGDEDASSDGDAEGLRDEADERPGKGKSKGKGKPNRFVRKDLPSQSYYRDTSEFQAIPIGAPPDKRPIRRWKRSDDRCGIVVNPALQGM